jgi:release factor glutamine methyltransferase
MTVARPTEESAAHLPAQILDSGRDTVGRQFLRALVHFFAYHFVLARRRERRVKAAGFWLEVAPTVFDPRVFFISEFFARFILAHDLTGKRVADVGTGTGILALAAACAGASRVVALDINPAAVSTARRNADSNGFRERVIALESDLLAVLPPRPDFDVIISDPPPFPGEPLDIADRAWSAGPDYRDIADLFRQAKLRLATGGVMYLSLSIHSDLTRLGELISAAGFEPRLAAEHSIWIDRFLLLELRQAP